MIWTAILQSRIVRWIGAAVIAVLAVLTFGAVKRREGVKAERASRSAQDAADFAETVKEVSRETVSTEPVDAIRDRLRERAGRKP